MISQHHCSQLVTIFNALFEIPYNTRLVGGGEEPLYLPSDTQQNCHLLVFREDYFASALHEISHWCIAGRSRRKQKDFGYWYIPDGRNQQQQTSFEQVEIKPQALEWIFSVAAGYSFRISSDNLNSDNLNSDNLSSDNLNSISCDDETLDSSLLIGEIYDQVLVFARDGLPPRASQFHQGLIEFFETVVDDDSFNPDDL